MKPATVLPLWLIWCSLLLSSSIAPNTRPGSRPRRLHSSRPPTEPLPTPAHPGPVPPHDALPYPASESGEPPHSPFSNHAALQEQYELANHEQIHALHRHRSRDRSLPHATTPQSITDDLLLRADTDYNGLFGPTEPAFAHSASSLSAASNPADVNRRILKMSQRLSKKKDRASKRRKAPERAGMSASTLQAKAVERFPSRLDRTGEAGTRLVGNEVAEVEGRLRSLPRLLKE